MSRRMIKSVLFFGGLVIAVAASVLLFFNFSEPAIPGFFGSTMGVIVAMTAGTTPMSIALLLHSADVRETKKSFSIMIKTLAIFWLVIGGLNLVGLTILSIVFS